jgi:DNA polymerase III epsilon subunit-like protein
MAKEGDMDNYGIIIDLETGGLDPARCAVTEIGAIAFEQLRGTLVEVDCFQTLVSPPDFLDITRDAATVQGHTAAELWEREAPTEGKAMVAFAGFFWKWFDTTPYRRNAHRIWAHNAGFDESFLRGIADRNRATVGFPFLYDPLTHFSCTLRLFQQQQAFGLWPEMEGVIGGGGSLGKLCEAWGIGRKEPHDAISDCRSTLAVLDRLQKRMRASGLPAQA